MVVRVTDRHRPEGEVPRLKPVGGRVLQTRAGSPGIPRVGSLPERIKGEMLPVLPAHTELLVRRTFKTDWRSDTICESRG
jgi:hypothetical protein